MVNYFLKPVFMTIRQPNAYMQSSLFAVTVAAKIGRECLKQWINYVVFF
jgi:hypothetical protein